MRWDVAGGLVLARPRQHTRGGIRRGAGAGKAGGLELGKVRAMCFPAGGLPSHSTLPVSSKLLRRLLLAPVVLFLGLELILWIFVRTPLEPMKKLDLSNDLAGLKKDVRLVFDKNLVRYLDDASGSKSAGTTRILCLGGTGTFAMFQNAEDTWWGQLGRRLQAKSHKVEVAAWGQDRTGIIASTPIAAFLMEEWKPDIVIANFGYDDVVGQPLDYQYQPDKARRLPGPTRPAGWKQAILRVSQTARLARWWMRHNEEGQLQNKIGRTDYWKDTFAAMKKEVNKTSVQPIPPRPANQDPLQEYLDGWRVLQELSNRYGAALLMTGEASLHDSTNNYSQTENLLSLVPLSSVSGPEARFYRPEPSWVEREMMRYAEAAETLAGTAKLPWIDLNGRVPRDLDHFFSDVILTDKGAAAIAGALLPVVEPVLAAKGK